MALPLFRILTGTVLLMLSFDLIAQEISDPPPTEFDDDSYLEEVIVTGTRIARRDFNTPSPLTTVDKTDIEFTVLPTIEETLNQMPQVYPGLGRASNNPSSLPPSGTATVDLRGLGAGRTLVLLNGRRVAPFDTGNAVDLNNIPRFLLERIEIITGGTSTVYGSDAIAGVVNFITRSDYTGLGFEAGYNVSEQGDAESYDISVAYGHGFTSGRGNIAFFANFLERKPLLADARDFTRYAWIDNGEGSLYQGGHSSIPPGLVVSPEVDLGSGPAGVTFNPDGTPRSYDPFTDLYNYQPVNYLQIPLERYAVGALGHYDLTDRFEGYFEASFIRNESAVNLASVPALLFVEVNLDNPVLTPETRALFTEYYTSDDPDRCPPDRACFNFRRRMLEAGERFSDFERDYTRLLAGFRGELGKGWDIDAWITSTKQSSAWFLRNDVSRSRFLQGLLVDPTSNECYDPTGGCVPLDLFGEGRLSAEGAGFIRHQSYENVTERNHVQAAVIATGSLFDTWAGPVDAAFGLEWRSDDTFFKADDALSSGDAMGWGAWASVVGVERVTEIYGEALIPLLSGKSWADGLDLEIGGRYTQHERASGFWTYKAGFSWRVVDSLQLRSMYQRSVRAPNSQELFEQQSHWEWFLFGWEDDPCSASADPVGNGNVEKCLIQGLAEDQIGVFQHIPYYPVDIYFGGNPDLETEVGKTWTAGTVISPASWSRWMFTVDYFWLELTDTIGLVFSDLVCFDPLNAANVFCENLKRDESGNVFQQWDLTSNRGLLKTSGLDTQVQCRSDLPEWMALADHSASLNVNLYWTHVFSYEFQDNPVTTIQECTGLFGSPCDAIAYPENRTTTHINYLSGPLDVYLSWRWIDGTRNGRPLQEAIFGDPDFEPAVPRINDKHYFDLGAAWNFSGRYQLRFGVNNLLDTKPPMMADQAFTNNTDTGLYDVFGRGYRLSFLAQF